MYHVAPDGDDSNGGGESDPFATFAPVSEDGSHSVSPGDTIKIHGGTVSIDEGETGVFWDADGLTIEPYGDGTPVVDASPYGDRSDTNVESKPVIWIGRSTDVTIRGLEIVGGPAESVKFENCAKSASVPFASVDDMKVGGHVVDCTVHHCGLPLMWGEGRGGVAERVEAYANFGPEDPDLGSNLGGDADGIQFTSGPNDAEAHRGGAVIGCSLHHNSDDGLDLYRASGMVIRDSVAYANGYDLNGEKVGEAPGKGFKLGGGDTDFDTGGTIIHNCAAWMNGAPGIGLNGANLPCDIWNNTAFGNARVRGSGDIELYTKDGPSGMQTDRSTVYNNIAEQGVATFETNLQEERTESNNFDVSGSVTTVLSEYGFASTATDDAGSPTEWSSFLRLTDGSPAIDAGTATPADTPANQYHDGATELDFSGTAPDMGAYPFDSGGGADYSLDTGVVVDNAFVRNHGGSHDAVVSFRNVTDSPVSVSVPVLVDGQEVATRSVSLGTVSRQRPTTIDDSEPPVTRAVEHALDLSGGAVTVRIGPVTFQVDADGTAVVHN